MKAVVFSLHGCPLTAFGAYGNEWIVTPHLDRLAAESVVFDHHISDCPDPIAARHAWRTGRHHHPASATETRPESDLLTLLTSAGVHSVLVMQTRPENTPTSAFLAGWTQIHTVPLDAPDHLITTLTELLDDCRTRPAFLLWLELDRLLPPWDVPQEVFNLYIEDLLEEEPADKPDEETADEHTPEWDDASHEDADAIASLSSDDADNDDDDDDGEEDDAEADVVAPPEPVRPWSHPPVGWFDRDDFPSWELLHRSFAATVSGFDAELGRVFDLFRARGLDASAHWILTADYGFPLGEHGMIGRYRPWLHEELIHLPFFIRWPHAEGAGTRISALTQPADLMATLASWFNLTVADARGDGVNLAEWVAHPEKATRTEALTVLTLGSASEAAMRTVDRAVLVPLTTDPEDDPREPQLYEKPADRWEVNNIRQQDLDRAEVWEQQLRTRFTSPPE